MAEQTILDLALVSGNVPADYSIVVNGPGSGDATERCLPKQLGRLLVTNQTSAVSINNGDLFVADVETAGGSLVFPMPSSPNTNDVLGLILGNKTTDGYTAALNPNGKNIEGDSGNHILHADGQGLIIQYNGTEWKIISRVPARKQLVKAWAEIDGTGTPSVTDGFNVDSITDNGTGDYTIGFEQDMPSAAYCVNGSNVADGTNFVRTIGVRTRAVGSVRIESRFSSSGSSGAFDYDAISVSVFSDE